MRGCWESVMVSLHGLSISRRWIVRISRCTSVHQFRRIVTVPSNQVELLFDLGASATEGYIRVLLLYFALIFLFPMEYALLLPALCTLEYIHLQQLPSITDSAPGIVRLSLTPHRAFFSLT